MEILKQCASAAKMSEIRRSKRYLIVILHNSPIHKYALLHMIHMAYFLKKYL